jgi:hypothetical protein
MFVTIIHSRGDGGDGTGALNAGMASDASDQIIPLTSQASIVENLEEVECISVPQHEESR